MEGVAAPQLDAMKYFVFKRLEACDWLKDDMFTYTLLYFICFY